MKAKYFLLLVIIFFRINFTQAQEISVFLNEENTIEVIDSELKEKLMLFLEYDNFKEARVFKRDENTYFLVIQYKKNDKLQQNRVTLDSVAYLDLRKKVSSAIREVDYTIGLDRDGRSEWLLGTTCLSLGFYGWAIPTILRISDKAAVATYLLTGASGFFIPYFISENRDISHSSAQLSVYGGASGILHGLLLYELFNGNDGKERLASMFGISVTELVLGFVIGKNLYKGHTDVMTSMATFGTVYGFGLAAPLGLYSSDYGKTGWAASALFGTAAGYYVGSIMADKLHYTPGDANVVSTFGIVGGYVPVALLALADVELDKYYTLFPILGSVGGLYLGHCLIKDKDFSDGNGLLIEVGTMASTLLGMGIGYMISNEGGTILTAGAIGSVLGISALYSTLAEQSKSDVSLNNLKINFQPSGLLPIFSSKYEKMNLNLLNIRYNF